MIAYDHESLEQCVLFGFQIDEDIRTQKFVYLINPFFYKEINHVYKLEYVYQSFVSYLDQLCQKWPNLLFTDMK